MRVPAAAELRIRILVWAFKDNRIMQNKYSFLILSLLLVGGCSLYIDEKDPIRLEENKGVVLQFTATTGEEDETKTEWQSNGEIWWNPEEDICIFYGASDKNRFTSTNDEKVKKATFTGTLSAFTGETESGDFNYFWAVYPYDAAVSCDGTAVVATLPHNQTAQVGTFSPNTNLTIAKSAGLSLAFYNVCAWFRFSVAQEGVKVVVFRGNNNEDVAGTFSVSMNESSRPTTTEVLDGQGQKEIRLTLPNDEAFVVGENYYFTLLPQTFSKGFTLEFETDYSNGQRSVNSSVTFVRNVYHWGDSFDGNIVYDCTEMPLCFEAIESGTINISHVGSLQYNKNNAGWTSCSGDVAVTPGDKVFFKGTGCLVYDDDIDSYTYFHINFKGYLYGNLMSLLDPDNYSTLTVPPTDFYAGGLFQNAKILSHPNNELVLPATALTNDCYYGMFSGCTELTRAPELPATELAAQCYYGMFQGCTKLTTAPKILPATTLARGCYDKMFYRCTSLTAAPELPAVELSHTCYEQMFMGCSSLAKAPYLPALELAYGCYYGMFYNCASLQDITIMATDISASSCLTDWVSGVSSIGTITKNCNATWDVVGVNGTPASWIIETDHPYVDLGLSVLWSQYNIGASAIDDIGDYYSWGETTSKTTYTWETYQYGKYSDGTLSKYCTDESYGVVDNLTELDLSNDAANVSWGDSWKMPSKDNFEEMESNCTVKDERTGLLKVTGPNGNYIFMPYNPIRDDSGIYPTSLTSATYWSSTLYGSDCRYAYAYYIWTNPTDPVSWGGYDRYVGYPIRPIKAK